MRCGCVIMASGLGRRFGSDKLMAQFMGKPLISHILETTAGIFDKIVVVTRNDDVYDLCNAGSIPCILHTFPYRNDTIRIGIEEMSDMDACMFCPSDQPLLSRVSIRKLLDTYFLNPGKIVRLSYKDVIGMPVIFADKYFDELKQLPEKKGGSYLIKKYANEVVLTGAEHKYELLDIDTAKDLQTLTDICKEVHLYD